MNSRILLIEDGPVNIQALSAILKEQGYQISVATSGQQGLDLLTRLRPDLILLDVMMPGIDGFETCRRIKASSAWRDIPIIFLTARTETADIVRGFEVGAVDYVAKPFNAHELLARVRTHLALDQLHRENQRLLLNVLPAPIAEKLKKQTGIIAERFDDVSVLFADIVGFTPLSARLPPVELLELLNRVFSRFDELAERHGLEKSKPSVTLTWWQAGCPSRAPIISSPWRRWGWRCWKASGRSTMTPANSACVSACTWAASSRASSASANSYTMPGATP